VRSLFAYLAKPQERDRRAAAHYAALVAQARQLVFYESLGVPDTLDGRFDLIVLHACLYLKRLRLAGRDGRELAQSVFDHMFANLDQSLRELGVGDITIPRKMRAMVEAFFGRAAAYDDALAASDERALAEAMLRNIYAGAPPANDGVTRLCRYVRAAAQALAAAPDEALLAGKFHWPEPAMQDGETNGRN
jgi:cytochrome b pre-mRNA-processing protein 3